MRTKACQACGSWRESGQSRSQPVSDIKEQVADGSIVAAKAASAAHVMVDVASSTKAATTKVVDVAAAAAIATSAAVALIAVHCTRHASVHARNAST